MQKDDIKQNVLKRPNLSEAVIKLNRDASKSKITITDQLRHSNTKKVRVLLWSLVIERKRYNKKKLLKNARGNVTTEKISGK